MSVPWRVGIRPAFSTAALLAAALFVPAAASASTIVVSSIGTFSWVDGFFGSDISLANDSALAGFPADFTAVVLTLQGDREGDGFTDSETLNGFGSILGHAPGANSWFESWSSLNTAVLTFSFNPVLPDGFTAIEGQSNFSILLGGQNEVFLQYSYLAPDAPPDPNTVPEPGSLLLIGLGLAATAAWRRRVGSRSGPQ